MRHMPPGLLRPSINPDVIMMVCTAGHVDHGKTSLVKLLTGCNTDRLKVEQERGMTIELGFAPCFLGGNLCMGIVDVPGHEKFIKNMVAGVSGIQMTVLVIAADDGVMPQTIEHFQIMELLGVRYGMVALTKIDLVSEERVAEVEQEIRGFLHGTFLDGAPICPVSSETLAGYGEFYETLVALVSKIVKRRSTGVFRMPVERVFAREGFGTVVTGIPVDGLISVGEQLELVPGNGNAKVRSIQRFLRDAQTGGYGQCLALNLSDSGKLSAQRGQVLCQPGYLKASSQVHVSLRAVSGMERPIKNAESIKFHTGTAELDGKIYLLEGKELGEGAEGFATIVLTSPVAAAVHDRFILRRPSPASTVAGGEVLALAKAEEREPRKRVLERLQLYREFLGDVDPVTSEGQRRKIEYYLCVEKPCGATSKEISTGALLPAQVLSPQLAQLVEEKKVLALSAELFIHEQSYKKCLGLIEKRLHEALEEKKSLAMTLSDLRQGLDWSSVLWARVQGDLERKGLVSFQGSKVVLRQAGEKLDPAERALVEKLLRIYEEGGFQSPRPDELPEILKTPPPKVKRLLDFLFSQGQLVRLSDAVVLSRAHFIKAQAMVVDVIKKNGKLDSADFKYHIKSSRKYALAILDYMDSRRITIRIQNDRKLAPDYQRNLLA